MANHTRCSRSLFGAILTTLTPIAAVGQTPTGDPPRFVYVDLPGPDQNPYTNLAHAINDFGVTTGVAVFPNSNPPPGFPPLHSHAFTAAPGEGMVDISNDPSAGINYSEAWDINNLGVAVGAAIFPNIPNPNNLSGSYAPPALWENGSVISLGLPKGTLGGIACAVNDKKQVVGHIGLPLSDGGPVLRSFLWENGQMRLLDELGPFTSRAWDINNLGHIVGEVMKPSFTPYLVRDGKAIVFDFRGRAFALNDLDQVVGWGGFIWEDGKSVTLPSIPFSECLWPRDINNLGDIVGDCTGGAAVLWRDGEVYNLNDLVQPSIANVYYLTRGFGINNVGQITGIAGEFGGSHNFRAFRLDPVTPDFDSDGVVTIQDLQQLLVVWGSATDPYMDLTGDGVVNSADLANLLVNWGNVPVRQPYSWTKNAP